VVATAFAFRARNRTVNRHGEATVQMFAAVLAIDSERFESVAKFFTFLPIVIRDPKAARSKVSQGCLVEFYVVKVRDLVVELAFIGGSIERARKLRHGRFLGVALHLLEGSFVAGREDFASVSKTHAIKPLHELDCVAGFPALARHATEETFCGRHDQVGRFFIGMERAKPRPVASLLFQGRPARLDQRDKVSFRFEAVDFGVGDSGHFFGVWFWAETKRPPALPFPRSAGPIGSRFGLVSSGFLSGKVTAGLFCAFQGVG
jgi:hypothetical protein